MARKLTAIPRVGDTLGMMLDPTLYLVDKYLHHGPVSKLKTLYQTYTVLAGVEAAAFMSSREGRECLSVGDSWRFVEEQFGAKQSLVTVDGKQHKELRGMLQRGYSRDAIMGRYQEAVALIDAALAKEWAAGSRVRVLPSMQALSIAQVGVFAAGVQPNDAYVADVGFVASQVLKIAPVQQIPKTLLKRRNFLTARDRVVEIAKHAIDHARSSAGHQGTAKSTLIADIVSSHADEQDPVKRQNMVFNAVLPYFAGVETTSATATYALYLILKHPDVLKRIRAEVDELFAGEITHDRLFAVTPTLNGAIMEAMRMHPVAATMVRVATKDFEFKGHQIRQGDKVFVATSVSHFLDDCFTDPTTFDVDRYQGRNSEYRVPGAYSPFGRGPHMCIGKGLAEALMQISLARLLHQRDLRLKPGYHIKKRLASTTPSQRFFVDVTNRDS
ncbi:cytochrome [Mycobacterium sp. NS-7484]|uniref:cytochrome P450 n=1 Tax=Mycobacterium sp. NS-7484 TaxID=1834161 RepID=UPI00096E5929|nr:cytochrome P450 [Mycobacterium sp. NS-7484]OMB97285.1 cytochrome [Mycobacterium sp. NS-7484]